MSSKPEMSHDEVKAKVSAKVAEVLKEIQKTHDLPKGQTIKLNSIAEAWEVSYKT